MSNFIAEITLSPCIYNSDKEANTAGAYCTHEQHRSIYPFFKFVIYGLCNFSLMEQDIWHLLF